MRLIVTLAALALATAPALAQQAPPPDPTATAQPAPPAAPAPAPQAAAPAAVAGPAPATAQPAPGAVAAVPPAAAPAAAPAAQPGPADVTKGVHCATLSQQFGDTLAALTAPTAKQKLDEAVAKGASEQAGAGRKACITHDYDAGLDQLRQAIGQLGKKAVL